MKKTYIKPACVEVYIDTTQMLAMSGCGTDSDDSVFGFSVQHRGGWGNLWEQKQQSLWDNHWE